MAPNEIKKESVKRGGRRGKIEKWERGMPDDIQSLMLVVPTDAAHLD